MASTGPRAAGLRRLSAAGDFGAYIGLNRGIEGSLALPPCGNRDSLIDDPYTVCQVRRGSANPLSYLWAVDFPPDGQSFKRLKFVA